jgi:hypothetical protein
MLLDLRSGGLQAARCRALEWIESIELETNEQNKTVN